MRRLRQEDAAGTAGDPRAEMAALAWRFPGALRQIDRLSSPEIDARLVALEAAVLGGEAPRWALWEIAYHGRMRATLRVKRVVRGAADAEALALATEAWGREADEPREAMTEERLRAIRAPEDGRLNKSVLAAVADEHGVSVEEIHAALFVAVCVESE